LTGNSRKQYIKTFLLIQQPHCPWASHSTLEIYTFFCSDNAALSESIQYYGMLRGQNQYGCCIGKKCLFINHSIPPSKK